MGRKKRGVLPREVKQLRTRIERWRRRRLKRSPMPAQLWDEAVSLARRQGNYRIATELGLNYDNLKKRIETAQEKGGKGTSGVVEVDGGQLFGAFELARTAVEISDAGGAKLVIRLSGREELDVVGLAEAFWRRGE